MAAKKQPFIAPTSGKASKSKGAANRASDVLVESTRSSTKGSFVYKGGSQKAAPVQSPARSGSVSKSQASAAVKSLASSVLTQSNKKK